MQFEDTFLNGFLGIFTLAVSLSATSAGASADSAEKTLYQFRGGSGGAAPFGLLIADGSGHLYGTTALGGGGSCEYGCGVIFEIGPHQKEIVRYTFAGGNDGVEPLAGLIADDTGDFFGTTVLGGGSANCGSVGCGTVFELAANGTETVLYAFQGGNDGFQPGNLVEDKYHNLYGETISGGSYNGSNCDVDGCGTVFEVQPDMTKLTLHAFQSGSDGAGPGWVILDGEGNLYGTTYSGGGSGCGGGGCGTVFEIAQDGTETVLYAFQGGSDGAGPVGLVGDKAGNLYGVTDGGGSCSYYDDCGTIYKLAPDGTKTLLYDFQGGALDGRTPESALIIDKAGNLYGTTLTGGGTHCQKVGCGTVFKLAPDGTETVLYAFTPGHGENPAAGLLMGKHGELYGTATAGGKPKDGVVFEVKK